MACHARQETRYQRVSAVNQRQGGAPKCLYQSIKLFTDYTRVYHCPHALLPVRPTVASLQN